MRKADWRFGLKIDAGGSCLCGTVRYTVAGAVNDFYICHCKRCQKETSSAFSTSVLVALESVTWHSGSDSTRRFELADADHFCLDFCTNCGSVVPYLGRSQQFYIVPVGTLDGDVNLRPEKQIFWRDRASWYDDVEYCPRFDAYQ